MKFIYDPPELELMHQTSLEQVIEWVAKLLGPNNPVPDFPDRVREEFAPLMSNWIEGDALWWCQSKFRAPLIGNEGVALIREGRPIIYMLMLNH